jgi:N-acetylmuramoyl-L-alanine amidase
MYIIKPNFEWRSPLSPLDLKRVSSIALHHMAHETADEHTIHRWHLERDNGTWKGFGYNYWIGLDGRVIEGRGLNEGAGVKDHNKTIISIGFQGNYDAIKDMPKAQFEAGVELIQWLKPKLPNLKAVDGHNRWNPTSCPGRYFPLKQMIDAADESVNVDAIHWKTKIIKEAFSEGLIYDFEKWEENKDEPMPVWAALATALNIIKKLKG